MKALERAFRHNLGSVGHHLQAREVELLVRFAYQQQVQKRGRCRQELHPMILNGTADSLGSTIWNRYDATPIRKVVHQGIEPPDVVEQQKRNSSETVTLDLKLLQHRHKIVNRCLALTCRPRREKHEARHF